MDTTQVIDELAKKFGTTAEYLIKEMARYNIATDIVSIVISILLLVGSAIAVKIMFKKVKSNEWGSDDDKVMMISLFGVIGCACGVVCFFINLVDCIGWIVSPTAGAIKYICK